MALVFTVSCFLLIANYLTYLSLSICFALDRSFSALRNSTCSNLHLVRLVLLLLRKITSRIVIGFKTPAHHAELLDALLSLTCDLDH